jgi:hypothetical protein
MFKKLIGTRKNGKSEKEQSLPYLQTFNIIGIFLSPFLAKLFAFVKHHKPTNYNIGIDMTYCRTLVCVELNNF